MYNRVYNFAAGPSQLPIEVLEQISKDLFNYNGTGMSVMEMSHRSKDYLTIFEEVKATIRKVMNIPDNYEIIFTQGGATEQFAAIPLNLLKKGKADYIVTGVFAKKAAAEARKYGEINIAYDGKDNYNHIPSQDELNLSSDADYVYICANNTVYGTQWKQYPNTNGIPLIADMSSEICSKVIDINNFGMIYAGCQKNMGIAGLALLIIRKDLIEETGKTMPALFDYLAQVKADSMINTPNTFAIYVLGLVAKWIDNKGGIKEIEKINNKKAQLIYDVIDNSDFYSGHADKQSRSNMNITFKLPSEQLDEKFVKEAKQYDLVGLKGYRTVGGIRVSIYNAVTLQAVEKLVEFMKKFEMENK